MPGSAGSIATFDHRDFPETELRAWKGSKTVSVCIPARDEEETITGVVSAVVGHLLGDLVDELVVVDDGSLDRTAELARRAGAQVVWSTETRVGEPVGVGKGGAMRRGLAETSGDFVVFLDADVTNLGPHFVTGLLGPLLTHEEILLVKGFYERPVPGDPTGGGRVTELTARPVIALLFPELSGVNQPLAGETAGRRGVLESLQFEAGYGVEMGLLLDVAAKDGTDALAQVNLGQRVHRNRALADLAPQAREVLAVALGRAGVLGG